MNETKNCTFVTEEKNTFNLKKKKLFILGMCSALKFFNLLRIFSSSRIELKMETFY